MCTFLRQWFLFPLDKYSEVELLSHMVVLFWILKGTFILFSTVAAPIYIPISNGDGFPSLHLCLLVCFVFSCVLDDSPTDTCSDGLVWLWFTFPWWVGMLTTISSLEKYFFRSIFLNQIFWLSSIGLYELLYILLIKPLLVLWFAGIFSCSADCLFILLMVPFAVQKLFNLM